MLCKDKITLKMFRGDSITFVIDSDPAFDVATATSILFTAKNTIHDLDGGAIIQKALGLGITVLGANRCTVALVPQDTLAISTLYTALVWDLQIQLASGAIRTVAAGILEIELDVTQNTSSSIPIYTTNPPVPGGGVASYTHVQGVDSDSWIINHNLGYYPLIDVLDSFLNLVVPEILHVSTNQVRVLFTTPLSGQARLV
jgi:hypothetical protein